MEKEGFDYLPEDTEQGKYEKISCELTEIKDEVVYLKDLFVRRLNEDKQKTQLINTLDALAHFAYIEPFLSEIILVLDRLEKADDEFSISIYDELYDILNRRGVERIEVKDEFDPSLFKAVKSRDNPNVSSVVVSQIVRNGYVFSGRVIRAAEVVVDRPVTQQE